MKYEIHVVILKAVKLGKQAGLSASECIRCRKNTAKNIIALLSLNDCETTIGSNRANIPCGMIDIVDDAL